LTVATFAFVCWACKQSRGKVASEKYVVWESTA
jgi:hypothetical protein